MERKDLIRNVLQAASDFHARRLWKRFSNFDCFAVKIPGRDEQMLGVVMGDAGEQFGLSLFRGERAAASLAAILEPDGPGDDTTEDTDMLGFTMDTFGELATEMQHLVREADLHPKYTDEVPSLLVKPAGRQPRLPDDSELALLLMVLRGAIEADEKKLLHPATMDDRLGVCTLVLAGGPAAPQVTVTRERCPVEEAPRTIPGPSPMPDLAGLPRLEETWLVGLFVLPAGIEGDDRSLQLLLVAEDASRFVLQGRPVFAGELDEAIGALAETFRGANMGGRKGLPREIVFSSRKLYDAMAPVLRLAGARCVYVPAIPKLQEIADGLLDGFGKDFPSFAERLEAADAQPVPGPDDLTGWKEADRRLTKRFVAFIKGDNRFRAARAVKRYFGRDDLEHFLAAHASRSVVPAYAAWAILDYRSTRKSKTPAEQMLAEGLPEAEALLLKARIESHPTLYRVATHDPKAGTVRLEDVLLGGEVTVYDQLLSENVEDGIFIAARAYPAGRFHFLEVVGPPLGAAMGQEAAEFLQDRGLELTRDGLRRDAHLFGRLWDWSDEWGANRQPPHILNTDGDDLVWHTASFHVSNPQALRQALSDRRDIEYDEGNEQFVWVGGTARGRKMLGGPVTLGRIEFVGDELVLSVNSAKRFERARKWLEKMPGVVFRDVTTRRFDDPDEERPMDERIAGPEPVEMTPDLVAGVQNMVNKQYMEWLDEPLPILGGKTPRQACATPAGRQQVAILIRTMPDPMGPAPVHVPREAMLRKLGLAVEPSPSPPLGSPMPPASTSHDPARARGKIGRNEPCPCGSGKKYKKCCGRATG